jgi:DNA-binding protein YbaB
MTLQFFFEKQQKVQNKLKKVKKIIYKKKVTHNTIENFCEINWDAFCY